MKKYSTTAYPVVLCNFILNSAMMGLNMQTTCNFALYIVK